jgi:hypothetical protein
VTQLAEVVERLGGQRAIIVGSPPTVKVRRVSFCVAGMPIDLVMSEVSLARLPTVRRVQQAEDVMVVGAAWWP